MTQPYGPRSLPVQGRVPRPVVTCLCHEPLRADANYCARCGREVRQLCPVCFEERRLIAKQDPYGSPWCGSRGELLCACARCGRWLTADARQCPDPGCRGLAAPTWPASTGKPADGAGRAAEWVWPAAWDRDNPNRTAPLHNEWYGESLIHTALVAHGRIYLWAETSLIAPHGSAAGPLPGTDSGDFDTPWRCWLGHDGEPNPLVSGSSQAAIVGGGAILAAKNGFLLAGLDPNRTDDVVTLDIGTPLAQVSGEGWWVGWSGVPSGSRDGYPQGAALWLAPTPASWRNLACRQIAEAPPQSAPRAGAPILLQGGMACWTDAEGALWQLDCRCREVQQVSEPIPGIQRIWRDDNGLHTIRAADNGLRVALGQGLDTGSVREVGGGIGPLRDVFASPVLAAVVGKQITALAPGTGDVIGEGKYSGRWVAGALAGAEANAADQEPRLLMLTEESGIGSLVALRPSSGVEDEIWRAPGLRPIGLIAAGESLYVVHERGVSRLQESLQ